MQITIIGAGAWGTALAIAACRQSPAYRVNLHARESAQAEAMKQQRCNERYLPRVELPASLVITGGSLDVGFLSAQPGDLFIIATPMAGLRSTLHALQGVVGSVAWLCKGFETGLGLMPHEVRMQMAPQMRAGALSGPSFAQEVAAQRPTALVAASPHESVRDALVKAFHSDSLRVYANDDIIGVEVGGAVKNVLAIAAGLCDGLDLGLNARAALITRGLAEMQRLGLALGARSDTFMGLSGLGDLVLTSTGDLSRNRKVGLCLAQGMGLQQAMDSLGHVAEGVYSARTVVQRATALGVDMPISQAVVDLLNGTLNPQQALAQLMGRSPKGEGNSARSRTV